MRLFALLLALALPAAGSEPIPLRVCANYDFTMVGNPVTQASTRCLAVSISGPDPAGAIDGFWSAFSTADSRATQLWDDLRGAARENSWLTLALRRVSFTGPDGAIRSADFPASGPGSVAYRRVRVWLPGQAYQFDYLKDGGRGPDRLLDIGKPIGAHP